MIDVVNRYAGLVECLLEDVGYLARCEGVYLASVHGHEIVGSVVDDGSVAGGRDCLGFSSVYAFQIFMPRSIRMHSISQNTKSIPIIIAIILTTQHHGPGPIPKQNARISIIPINPSRQRIGTQHQRILHSVPIAQKLARGNNPKQEPGTRRREIKRGITGFVASHGIGNGGSIPEQIVRTGRRADDQVDVRGVDSRHGQGGLRSLDAEGAQIFGSFGIDLVSVLCFFNDRPRTVVN
mmetsp:Transcript_35878/g.61195  ORF Transcript_35878/g.61195 Transcript_35878/m.61195 type:complete len:237 (+) Transcript_35878:339-1049(+)